MLGESNLTLDGIYLKHGKGFLDEVPTKQSQPRHVGGEGGHSGYGIRGQNTGDNYAATHRLCG